jgi:hypothetical protein
VAADQTLQCAFDLNALSDARKEVRQVKKHVAMNHLSRTT